MLEERQKVYFAVSLRLHDVDREELVDVPGDEGKAPERVIENTLRFLAHSMDYCGVPLGIEFRGDVLCKNKEMTEDLMRPALQARAQYWGTIFDEVTWMTKFSRRDGRGRYEEVEYEPENWRLRLEPEDAVKILKDFMPDVSNCDEEPELCYCSTCQKQEAFLSLGDDDF